MPIIAEEFIERIFLPQLTALRDAIFDRVLPAFEGLEAEADRIERETFEGLSANASEYTDESQLVELAFDVALYHFKTMTAMRQTVINTLAIAIDHLFEQQRHMLSFGTLFDWEPSSKQREKRFRELLEARGLDFTMFIHHAKLDELHVVANVAKHAAGQSAERLRTLRPDLLVAPLYRADPFSGSPIFLPVNAL